MARITPRPEATRHERLSTLRTACPSCDHRMWFTYEDQRKVTTLEEVIGLTLQVRRCVNPACERYHVAYRPEAEGSLALPHHEFGLDVIAWIGSQRYCEHKSLPEIHRQLQERGVVIAERTVEHLLARYDELVSMSVADRQRLEAVLEKQGRLVVATDGLQPDKGHEVLWVIREVLSGSVTYGPRAGAPTVGRRGSGCARRAKNVSAGGWSLVLAEPKPKPVIAPRGLTDNSTSKPSYQPGRLLQPISANPGSQPDPRRLASRVTAAVPSNAS